MAEKIAGDPKSSAMWASEAFDRPRKFLQILCLGTLL